MKRCLCCYRPLHVGEIDYHPQCAKKIFGSPTAPVLPYTRKDINDLAQVIVANSTTVTGVQSKLSIDLQQDNIGEPQRLTIVGLMGRYILKPQTERFERLPEIEDLSMHLAEIAKIPTVPHALIRFIDGELNYITRRIDRTDDGQKLPMEDMCQLSGKLTEQKYQGSYELIAKIIEQYSSLPQLDKINYWQQVVFSWIIGNTDMHLKNFSLYSPRTGQYVLSPTYDQVSTKIVMPEDTEEMALSLNGFKKKLLVYDFREAMYSTGIPEVVTKRILSDFSKFRDKWFTCIDASFISDDQKQSYKALIDSRLDVLAWE
ncbi:HipA domain-containing protein [Prevotella jejuni]|uniref:HipA domain-containing protein n=1 Tax=Prevotella jejuni TaxID=1177574 RepID=UPI00352F0F7E